MSADLEQLLRATFATAAESMDSGPRWNGAPQRRARWIAPLAAAAAVIVVVGAVATWRAVAARHEATSTPQTTCAAHLPSVWTNALAGPLLSTAGGSLQALTILPSGKIIAESVKANGDTSVELESFPQSGSARTLYRVPAGRMLVGASSAADDQHLVFGLSAAKGSSSLEAPLDDIVVISLSSGAVSQLPLHAPGVPSSWAVGGPWTALQDGVVYWGLQPAVATPSRGAVVSYSLATKELRVVARTLAAPHLSQDARGVFWHGGHVALAGIPGPLPRLGDVGAGDAGSIYVFSDGTAYAWIDPTHPRVVHWVDRAGHARRYPVALPGRPGAVPLVNAVSGPFVFITWEAISNPVSYVLDTRTGAFAPIGTGSVAAYSASGSTAFTTGVGGSHSSLRPVRTGALPELRC